MSDPGEVERVAAAIRAAWCEWARTQPNPKPSWLVPWDSLDEQSRDADRHLARWHLAALSLPAHGGTVSAATPRAEVGETSSDGPCRENDGCPTELAVLQRFWRSHQSPSHASRAEALEDAARLCEMRLSFSTEEDGSTSEGSHNAKLRSLAAAIRSLSPSHTLDAAKREFAGKARTALLAVLPFTTAGSNITRIVHDAICGSEWGKDDLLAHAKECPVIGAFKAITAERRGREGGA